MAAASSAVSQPDPHEQHAPVGAARDDGGRDETCGG